MIIECRNEISAIAVACHFISRGAGFKVHTREIFQSGPTIETGDDMWEATLDLMRARSDIDILPTPGAPL